MRLALTVAVSLAALPLLTCPVASPVVVSISHADPLSTEDSYFTKWLSENGVNYQGRVSLQTMIADAHTTCAMLDQSPTPQTYQAAVSRLVGGPGNFTQQEAKSTVLAAVNSYCSQHGNLLYH
ncbi:hypothetical protein LAUMK191_01511 [Mycobacterium attenuatum]|uniref:DUF732 domain-containing protein n=1 Tax=Mycobacterium attenuatum TaxID=2341086 RepID=A0A498PWN0_9MYCO|nr:DUF732 domain-containing protein [Mycobacterium attenuatum]VBA36672.1 hypothetical protein LAUMK136_01519 [Mycobacterium attenuatum]VBA49250.1 hypothetical protein LAUMK191_01511 [Mycobacterium attenuatum]